MAGNLYGTDHPSPTKFSSSEIAGNQIIPNVDTSSRSRMAGNLYQAHFEPSSIFVLQVQMEFIAGNQTSPNVDTSSRSRMAGNLYGTDQDESSVPYYMSIV